MLFVKHTIAALILALTASQAEAAKKRVPIDRNKFEITLLEKAKSDSIATDAFGAWLNIYSDILIARALDKKLYEKVLLNLESETEDCGRKWKLADSQLACAANRAAETASSLAAFSAAIEFRRDAVMFAERVTDKEPSTLLNALTDLASDEQIHGSFIEVEQAISKLEKLVIEKRLSLDFDQKFKISILRAKLADAKLDHESALRAFESAVEAAVRAKSGPFFASEGRKVGGAPLTELVELHIRNRFCQGCGTPIAEPVRKWIDTVLSGGADEDPNEGFAQDKFLLYALSLLNSTFSESIEKYKKIYNTRYVGQGPGPSQDFQKVLKIKNRFDASSTLALASTFTSYDGNIFDSISFINENNPRRRSLLAKNIFDKLIASDYEQFGDDRNVPIVLDRIAFYFSKFGLHEHSRLVLEALKRQAQQGDSVAQEQKLRKLAIVYAEALTQLARLQTDDQNRKEALKNLEKASALATQKLNKEWASGGPQAILTLRNLNPTLVSIAELRSLIFNSEHNSENKSDHDALFRSMQAAMLGETAIAVAVAEQRRFLSDTSLQVLRQRHLQAVAEAERAVEIANYHYASGDVDGALAKAQRKAEARRDALGREFKQKVPATFTSAADIESVSLADAASRLQDGEAITLLHVGSHGIHGFLLDRKGHSVAWRTVVKRETVEALVRSLRGSGDVSTSLFPSFPFADAAKLYDLAFGPARDRIGTYRKLIVVGDGPLQAMPYGLLLTKSVETPPRTAEEMRAAGLPWLIRSHAIALMPSVRSLVTQRSGTVAGRAGKPLLGIGDPKLADAGSSLRNIDVAGAFASNTGLADVAMLRRVASLPETADELRAIAKLVDARDDALLLGERATERAIRNMPLSDYRLIVFATHGALAGEVTGTREPGLLLSPPEQATSEDDGFLALSEIANLRLDADLVLLSACNTGTSDGRPRAEGLSGLARGFFSAGARSLVVTHWYIPSESAVKVTTGLIAERRQHPEMDWADAHRVATLTVMDKEGPAEWAHPAYWGGFAVVGVMPIVERRN